MDFVLFWTKTQQWCAGQKRRKRERPWSETCQPPKTIKHKTSSSSACHTCTNFNCQTFWAEVSATNDMCTGVSAINDMCTGVIFIQHLTEVCTTYSYVCFLYEKEQKRIWFRIMQKKSLITHFSFMRVEVDGLQHLCKWWKMAQTAQHEMWILPYIKDSQCTTSSIVLNRNHICGRRL